MFKNFDHKHLNINNTKKHNIYTIDGKTIGVIQILNKQKGRFTKADLNLINDISTQAAISIQNAQNSELFQKKREQEMEFVSVVSEVNV